jgi:tetratricopeptide (TPR) repeat protein
VRLQACVSISAVLIAIPALAQTDEWWQTMRAGLTADAAGDYVQSAALYRRAIEIAEKLDPADERRAFSWNAMGKTQDVLGNYAAAEAGYRRALKAAEQSRGPRSAAYTISLENLATLYSETGQISRGEKLARDALALVSEFHPRDELALAMAQSCLATIADLGGKHDEAARLAIASMAALEREPVAWAQAVATLNTIAAAVFARGDAEQAERRLLRAVTIAEEHDATGHPLLVRVWCNLGALALRTGRREEAGERFRKALAIAERRLGLAHPTYGTVLAWYAIYLRQTGDKARAKAMEAQSSQILKESGRRNGVGLLIDVTALRNTTR